ncbi:early endosome antigen 1-like isoform X2 [Sitophilus oryzae]|uniref:Early endosome antigen 1-like isoform X2 n=1 Tax=Sitophilus oryzae TaxID=7048 RepID=A0A6J2XKK4_SITOR|nr:early endosome antigen 1-like isoform X2 [Sitophilus oryzae]
MSCTQQGKKDPSNPDPPKCSACLHYMRKIETIERVQSGRETVISALQQQLKKCETNYKKLFDDFEKLRFEHSTAMQRNFSLKEINTKLEDGFFKPDENKSCRALQNESETIKVDNKKSYTENSCHPSVQKPVKASSIYGSRDRHNYSSFILKERVDSGDHIPKQSGETLGDELNAMMENFQRSNQGTRSLVLDENPSKVFSAIESNARLSYCKCNVLTKLDSVTDDNQRLSETLEIVNAENKNNLEIVRQLQEELKRAYNESEQTCNSLKQKLLNAENELEECRANERRMKQLAVSSHKSLDDTGGDGSQAMVNDLEAMVKELRGELIDKTAEMKEFEEERDHFCKKIELLMANNSDLSRRVQELQMQVQSCSRVPPKQSASSQMTPSFRDIEKELSKINQDKENLSKKFETSNELLMSKSKEAEEMRDYLRSQLEEMLAISQENEALKEEMEQVKKENELEAARLQNLVDKSQHQVAMLLQEHDEKTQEINKVVSELDSIRKCVSVDNNTKGEVVQKLERENEELNNKIRQLEMGNMGDCKCHSAALELESLRAELIKKQCTIAELESTLDTFNKTMQQFEQDIQDLVCQNECLKKDREKKITTIKNLQEQLGKSADNLNKATKQLSRSDANSDFNAKNMRALQAENEELKKRIEAMEIDKDISQRKLKSDNLQLELQVENARDEVKRSSQECSKRLQSLQRACDEIQNQCTQRCSTLERSLQDAQKYKVLAEEEKLRCECLQEDIVKLTRKSQEDKIEKMIMSDELRSLEQSYNELKKTCSTKSSDNEGPKRQVSCGTTPEHNSFQKESQTPRQTLRDEVTEQPSVKFSFQKIEPKPPKTCQAIQAHKQAQISREEYVSLRKEYRKIKSMLGEHLKNYKAEGVGVGGTGEVQGNCGQKCVVGEVTGQLKFKDIEMMNCQQKLQETAYEIIELKDYICKLTADNNTLKTAINNLINNLERKIKAPIKGQSVEAIASEILQSLSNIESTISKKCVTCETREYQHLSKDRK